MMYPRILAIDLRSQIFGFAVLEGPQTLLDFGRKILRVTNAQDHAILVRRKIGRLITFFAPTVIVLKYTSGCNDIELLKRKNAIAVIKQEAELRSVELIPLKRRDIYQAFRHSGKTSKYKLAELIVEMFPEVEWKLPPNRKTWQPEHHNMAIFDAISVGLAYSAQLGANSGADEQQVAANDI